MKKKIFLLLFLAMSIFSLSACSNKAQDDSNKTLESKKESKVISGFDAFHNKNARLAVVHAIDKEYIEKVVLGDGAKEADFIVPWGLSFDENGKDFREQAPNGYYHYDADKALEYWNKAKEELGFDKVTAVLLTYDDESRRKVCEYVQAQLMRNLPGLDVTLNVQPFKNKVDMAKQGNWDLDIGSWGSSYPDPQTFLELFYKGYSLNFGQYNSDEYSNLIDNIKFGDLARDAKKRFVAMNDAERILLEQDVALVPLVQIGASMLVKPNISGFKVIPAYQGEYIFRFIEQNKLTDNKKIVRTIATVDLPTVDPSLSNSTQSFTVLANIMESLTQIGEDGNILMAGASSYDVSEDGLKYTFHLRKDAKWQNGEPVLAKDYVFSWRRLVDPNTASDYSTVPATAGIKNAKQVANGELPLEDLGVRAIDDYTLEVELDVPVAFFLGLMAKPSFAPINEEFYNEHKEHFAMTVKDTLSNGPYKMETWEYGYGYSIVKNENYWDKDSVKSDGASFRILKDSSAAVNLYKTDELDIVPITGEFVEAYRENSELMQIVKARSYWLHFNFR